MPELVDQVVEEYVPALQAPLEGRIQPSPYNFEFTGNDALRIMVHNSVAGAVVGVHYRFKPREGEIIASADSFAPASDRMHDEIEIPLGVGYLLNVVAFATAGAPRIGQTFVKADVIRGRGSAATVLGTILQDYVTEMQPVAWPGSPLRSSLEGGGYVRQITGTNPAAGAAPSEEVPTGARWQVLTVTAQLTTDATVAVRRPYLGVIAGGAFVYVGAGAPTQAASSTQIFCWANGLWPSAAFGVSGSLEPLPAELVALAGHKIEIQCDNFQAGDDWTAPRMYVREWLEAN